MCVCSCGIESGRHGTHNGWQHVFPHVDAFTHNMFASAPLRFSANFKFLPRFLPPPPIQFSLAKVTKRRIVRASTNQDDWTVCQVAYYLSCGLFCATCAADSIGEKYLYTVMYLDTRNPGVDKDFPASLLQKYTAEVEATDASCVGVDPGGVDVIIEVQGTDQRGCGKTTDKTSVDSVK